MKKLNLNSMKISKEVKSSVLDIFYNSVENKNKITIISNKEDNTFFFSDIPINDNGYLTTTYNIPFTCLHDGKRKTLNNKTDIINEYYSDMSEIENPLNN